MNKKGRKGAGEGSVRKKIVKRNGKDYSFWEARYSCGFDPQTGEQIQRSISGKTQKEVTTKLREKLSELDKGIYIPPSELTAASWLDTWSQEYLVDTKPSTAFLYRENIRLYLKPGLGIVKMEALTTPVIQQFYKRLSEGKYSKAPLSPKTVKNIHGVLHRALDQAVSNGTIRSNPSSACTLPRITKAKIEPLTEEQVVAFLQAIEGHRHQSVYTVGLFTGLRQGELLGLQWKNIDFDRNTIRVEQQLQRNRSKGGGYYLATPKNNKARTVTVAPSVMTVLRGHQAKQETTRKFLGPAWVNSGFVFCNELGDRLSYRTVYDCYKRIVTDIGCPTARFHDLRHTYATMALEGGDDIKTVQENLGHHAASFTLDIYGHVSEKMRTQSADRMEQRMAEISTAVNSENS